MGKNPPPGKRGKVMSFRLTRRERAKLIESEKHPRRKQALIYLAEGETVKTVIGMCGISYVTLGRWVKKSAMNAIKAGVLVRDEEHLPFPEALRKVKEDDE